MKNPKTVETALTKVGAALVGKRGEADSNMGPDSQQQEISAWIDQLWPSLAEILLMDPLPEDKIYEMQEGLMRLS